MSRSLLRCLVRVGAERQAVSPAGSDVKFEWDPEKDEANRAKHGIGFEEAATVFGDRFALSWDDTQHSVGEYRTLTLGYTDRGRLAIVAHADRSERIRIITARFASKRERELYESA